jgi:Mg2+-importing ATPase
VLEALDGTPGPSRVGVGRRSGPQGLPAAEATRRLQADSPNAIGEEPAVGIAPLLLRQFKSPLMLILVFGGLVSAALSGWIDASIILAVVLGSGGLGILQDYRASNAVAQLRQRLSLTARVLRDATARSVPTRELVRAT